MVSSQWSVVSDAAGSLAARWRPIGWTVLLAYGLAGAWIAAMLVLGRAMPDQYRALLQEDRAVEWGTAWLFLAAGLLRLRPAIRGRRAFDGLVALFCLVVAGEEISWGQRLLGLGAPDYFLAHNYQQELTLHNLVQSAVRPKWLLTVALVGYGLLLPLVARSGRGRHLLARLGASAPPWSLAPGFAAAVALLIWYPLTLTGEWVELLAGALFLASLPLPPAIVWLALALAAVVGVGMAEGSRAAEGGQAADRVACADAEVRGLLHDLTAGAAATSRLQRMRLVHKRVWTAAADGYLSRAHTPAFDGAECGGAAAHDRDQRRRYAVDPWGTAYWLAVERVDRDQLRVVVYSFGPNRQRDGSAQAPAGDDVGATGVLRVTPPGEAAAPADEADLGMMRGTWDVGRRTWMRRMWMRGTWDVVVRRSPTSYATTSHVLRPTP